MTIFKRVLIASVVFAAALTTGCGALTDEPASNGVDVNHPDMAFAKLMKLPTIEEAVPQYQKLGAQIRQQLTKTFPELTPWRDTQDGVGGAGCLNNDGQEQDLSDFSVQRTLTDDQYEQALQAIGAILKPHGFGEPQRFHDSPGKHNSSFTNPTDHTVISFGSAKATALQISVGCHLTAEAKKRGHPSDDS